MSGWTLQIDSPSIAADRTMLDLNSGPIRVGTSQGGSAAIDWGQASITTYETQQGVFGNSVSDFVIPNRTVTIDLILGGTGYESQEETARSQLQQKVGLLQREGGQLMRQRNGGPAMYADITWAELAVPDVWGETGDVEPDVQLVLTCLPDFYGDEITLDTIHCTGVCDAVLTSSGTQAVIEGDYPARCRVIVTDTSGHNQLSAFWGMRSRYYGSATTDALVYEAEALTALSGATVTSLSGASGGSVVEQSSLPSGSWSPVLSTTISSGSHPLTHVGSYRVWARAYSSNDTPQLRLLWGVASLSVPVTNDAATLPGQSAFYLLDLGVIRLDAPPVGTQQWAGVIQAMPTSNGTNISIDCLYLQPLDEAAGLLEYVPVAPASSIEADSGPTASSAVNDSAAGTVAWSNPGNAANLDFTPATVTLTPGQQSEYLKVTGYPFAIPLGATILGVEADTISNVQTPDGSVSYNTFAKIVKAGTIVAGSNGVLFSDGYYADGYSEQKRGGSSAMWGTTLAPSDVNSSGFGIALSVESQSSNTIDMTTNVDFIGVRVWYELTSGFTVAQDAVVYANEATEIRWDRMVRSANGTVYGPVSQVAGDLCRLPPSGTEDRAAQLLVKPTRSDFATIADSGLDTFTAQVVYQPCWLSRP